MGSVAIPQIIRNDAASDPGKCPGAGMPLAVGGDMERHVAFTGNPDSSEAAGAVLHKGGTAGLGSHFANVEQIVGVYRHGMAEILLSGQGPFDRLINIAAAHNR